MKISVIIPTYNPTLKLEETLVKLVPQSNLIDELIIVIDNDTYADFAKYIVEKYQSALKIKVFSQPNSGRAISRNKGAEYSIGDILIFLDDDMLAESDLIEKHIQYHHKNPDIILSGNGYRNPEGAIDGFGKYLIKIEKNWKIGSPEMGEITLQNFSFTACNLSISRNLFKQLVGFDTRLSDCEDFDFGVRAITKRNHIVYDRNLLAWHNDWPEVGTYINRQNEYTSAKIELLKVHPEYLGYFPNLRVGEASKIKKMASAIIRVTIGKLVINKNRIFEMLPTSIKFILYHITISAYSNTNR